MYTEQITENTTTEVDTRKRARESTSPIIAQEAKKKNSDKIAKGTANYKQTETDKQTNNQTRTLNKPVTPPPPPLQQKPRMFVCGCGEREREREGGGERSITRMATLKLNTRDVGITIYFRRSSKYDTESHEKGKIEDSKRQ